MKFKDDRFIAHPGRTRTKRILDLLAHYPTGLTAHNIYEMIAYQEIDNDVDFQSVRSQLSAMKTAGLLRLEKHAPCDSCGATLSLHFITDKGRIFTLN